MERFRAEFNKLEPGETITHALQATTGLGKTRIAAAFIAASFIAELLRTTAIEGIVYAVPTHRLGEDIVQLFAAAGVTAKVWRGRDAHIQGKSGPTMCDNLSAVKAAVELGEVIETSACRRVEGKVLTRRYTSAGSSRHANTRRRSSLSRKCGLLLTRCCSKFKRSLVSRPSSSLMSRSTTQA
jgi:hypothetical protein